MVKKQTIQLELKNAPTGTPLAGCSANSQLTSPQRDSAVSETGLYLPEVDQQEVKPESDISDKVPVANMTRVFVLSYKGKPLMPCSPRKARVLLKEGKANVVKARPFFTIKLNYNVGGAKQDIDLNVDTGYEYIGFALVGIYCYLLGQLKLDNKMTQRLADRTMYRRNRRHRLRYRPARWQNRKKKDLPPSVQRRIDRHIWLIERLQSICPVTNINLETAQFDIQKINNPTIQGEEYQQGNLWRSNVRAYLFVRENSICQYCGKKIKQGERVEIHHIVQRSNGGTDKPDNLALLHDKCHAELHEKGDVKLKKNKQYKGETFMNVLRKRLLAYFPNAIECFGYETQSKRKQLKLEKTHCNDAFAISGVTEVLPNPVFLVEHRKNNRSLQVQKPHKQIAIRRKRYSIQPNDLAWIEHKRYVSKGSTGYGKQVWIMKDGKKQQISAKKIEKVYHFGTIGIEP